MRAASSRLTPISLNAFCKYVIFDSVVNDANCFCNVPPIMANATEFIQSIAVKSPFPITLFNTYVLDMSNALSVLICNAFDILSTRLKLFTISSGNFTGFDFTIAAISSALFPAPFKVFTSAFVLYNAAPVSASLLTPIPADIYIVFCNTRLPHSDHSSSLIPFSEVICSNRVIGFKVILTASIGFNTFCAF